MYQRWSCTAVWAILFLGLGPMNATASNDLDLTLEPWLAVNDVVMGGVSESEMTATEHGLRFQGDLSLDNNGGFASVRRLFAAGFAGVTGFRLCIRGDGRTYQFRLRADRQLDGTAWRAKFEAGNQWRIVDLPLSDFEPVWRGRLVADANPLDPSGIRQIGFLLADGRPGTFALDVRCIQPLGY